MENSVISVAVAGKLFDFQGVNNGGDKCEYEVCAGGRLVAVIGPDED